MVPRPAPGKFARQEIISQPASAQRLDGTVAIRSADAGNGRSAIRQGEIDAPACNGRITGAAFAEWKCQSRPCEIGDSEYAHGNIFSVCREDMASRRGESVSRLRRGYRRWHDVISGHSFTGCGLSAAHHTQRLPVLAQSYLALFAPSRICHSATAADL